jgi:hypothetical protein
VEKAHPPKKDLAKLALQFPTSFILKGIPLGSKKLSLLAQEKPGSWIAPTNSKERRKFMRQSKAKSVPTEFIMNSPPIFFCGDKTGKIKGIPVDGIVKNVSDSLLIIDLTHGFKYPLLPSQQDDLVLIRRDEAIKYENKLDHELITNTGFVPCFKFPFPQTGSYLG